MNAEPTKPSSSKPPQTQRPPPRLRKNLAAVGIAVVTIVVAAVLVWMSMPTMAKQMACALKGVSESDCTGNSTLRWLAGAVLVFGFGAAAKVAR